MQIAGSAQRFANRGLVDDPIHDRDVTALGNPADAAPKDRADLRNVELRQGFEEAEIGVLGILGRFGQCGRIGHGLGNGLRLGRGTRVGRGLGSGRGHRWGLGNFHHGGRIEGLRRDDRVGFGELVDVGHVGGRELPFRGVAFHGARNFGQRSLDRRCIDGRRLRDCCFDDRGLGNRGRCHRRIGCDRDFRPRWICVDDRRNVARFVYIRDRARLPEHVDDDRSVFDALDASRDLLAWRKRVLTRHPTREQMHERSVMMPGLRIFGRLASALLLAAPAALLLTARRLEVPGGARRVGLRRGVAGNRVRLRFRRSHVTRNGIGLRGGLGLVSDLGPGLACGLGPGLNDGLGAGFRFTGGLGFHRRHLSV